MDQEETSISHHGNLNNSHGESKASEEDTQEAQRTTNNYKNQQTKQNISGYWPKNFTDCTDEIKCSFLLKAFWGWQHAAQNKEGQNKKSFKSKVQLGRSGLHFKLAYNQQTGGEGCPDLKTHTDLEFMSL